MADGEDDADNFALQQRSRSFYCIAKTDVLVSLPKLLSVHSAKCSVLAVIAKTSKELAIDWSNIGGDHRSPVRTTLDRLICSHMHALVMSMADDESLHVMKDGFASDDLLALLHRVEWRAIGTRLARRPHVELPNAKERAAIWRAAEVIVRVIESTIPQESAVSPKKKPSRATSATSAPSRHSTTSERAWQRRDAEDGQRSTRAEALHRQLQREDDYEDEELFRNITAEGLASLEGKKQNNVDALLLDDWRVNGSFSVPLPPRLMADLLYRVSDWVESVGRWSPTSPIYWIESREHQLYELTPFGISDPILFHIDFDDGFSAPFGRSVPIGSADKAVPPALRDSFARFKSGETAWVLCDIDGCDFFSHQETLRAPRPRLNRRQPWQPSSI
jgi:hypothetical protein